MDKSLILKVLLIGMASGLVGAFLKILNYGFSDAFLLLSLILTIFCYIVTLIDMIKTSRDKSFWILIFIIIPTLAPLIYLIKKKS